MALTYKNLLKQNHTEEQLTVNHTSWVDDGLYSKNVSYYDCYLGRRPIPKAIADQLLATYQHKEIAYNSIYGLKSYGL